MVPLEIVLQMQFIGKPLQLAAGAANQRIDM
jgi:hypothetical protein